MDEINILNSQFKGKSFSQDSDLEDLCTEENVFLNHKLIKF